MKQTLLVLGGRSDIGLAIAHRFARDGFDVILAARRHETLAADRSDIEIRHGVTAYTVEFDAAAPETHEELYHSLPAGPEVVVYCAGFLGDQVRAESDQSHAAEIIAVNYSGAVSILSIAANALAERGTGSIIGISSVAGDRGRRSNYIYGSAKGGFTAFLAGLRHRLARSGVNVLTVKPGFVATRMTRDLPLPERLTASPDKLAEAVFRAYRRRRHTLYYLPIWRPIMFVIRTIPERLFLRTKL